MKFVFKTYNIIAYIDIDLVARCILIMKLILKPTKFIPGDRQ